MPVYRKHNGIYVSLNLQCLHSVIFLFQNFGALASANK